MSAAANLPSKTTTDPGAGAAVSALLQAYTGEVIEAGVDDKLLKGYTGGIVDLELADQVTQALWIPKRYKILFGGRGSSKSWGVAQELIVRGHETRLRILCAREIQRSISASVISLLSDTIKRCQLEDIYDVQKNAIYHPNGTEFLFAGLKHNVGSVQSMEGIDIVWIEEAQNVSAESWKVLIPTIRKAGSEIWVTFNPNLESDPTFDRFVKPYLEQMAANDGFYEDEDVVVARVNYDDNPWFPDVLRKEMEWDKARDFDKYRHVWLGECVRHNEARVFNNWQVEEFDTPKDATFYYGADWGFSVDPTTLIRCFADHDIRELRFDYEAYGVGVEIDDTPALFDQVPDSRRWAITADSARPETISYMKRQGFKVRKAKKGAGSVEEGVNFLKSYTIVVHPRCKHLIDELSFYSYKVDRLTGDVLPILEDKNNHCIDGARYALEKLAFNKSQIHIG